MPRYFGTIILVGAIAVGVYMYQDALRVFTHQLYAKVAPCTRPIPYTIDFIDPRFKLSTSSALAAVDRAAKLWDTAAGHDVFVYDPVQPVLTISFSYDSRQGTTDALKDLGSSVSDDMATYNAAKSRFDALSADFEQKRAAFDSAYAAYRARASQYQSDVTKWNGRGGAPTAEYERLQGVKSALESEQNSLQQTEQDLNGEARDVNALVDEVNRLAAALNIEATHFNKVSAAAQDEFEEGVYTSAAGQERIRIFEYDSEARLLRVLAHELGHALGLNHVDDKEAVMYELNQGSGVRLTKADLVELDVACRR